MKSQFIFRIAFSGVFAALCFVLTAFCQIPLPSGVGYLNFGDCVTLFASMTLGPIEGALVGMIGGSMGDLFLGYASYIPFTILAKCLLGVFTGLLFLLLKKHKALRFVSPFVGATSMILIYMLAYYLIEGPGVYLSSAFDCLQGYSMALISIPLTIAIEKSGVLNRFNC